MATNPDTNAIDMADREKSNVNQADGSVPSSSYAASSHSKPKKDSEDFVPRPMFHQPTHQSVDIEDYFKGPRDINRHSKWPYFLRMHGSILPKMVIPILIIGGWATLITCISKLVHPIHIESTLLTVLGFVVGLALSFRSTTAYERFSEGRRYWALLLLTARNMSRLIWVHAKERHEESEELGKQDLLAKLAALQLLNAFAVSLKHRLRFEPSVEYPDLAPLISNIYTLAGDADQAELREHKTSVWKNAGMYLGIPMAESNPRKLVKRTKHNLGNTPLEVLTYLSAYIETLFKQGQLAPPTHQTMATTYMNTFVDVLTNCERVVNTPLPIAYSISIAQITWCYVMALPFQLVTYLDWVAIPGTIVAGYIILGLAQIGRELENPFGQDVNDLPLDAFCHELANDIDALTSRPAPLNTQEWISGAGAKVLWPLSNWECKAWESRSVEDIRLALKAKAMSRDVKKERAGTFLESENLNATA